MLNKFFPNQNPDFEVLSSTRRKDIDGLRGIAVLSIIFFHAGHFGFQGGYLGVDIFFIISGYLITGIIVRDLGTGTFSLIQFYVRRFRRLLPAVVVTMMISIPFAFLYMIPEDLEDFGQSLVATSLFANNILLLVTTDYFGIEAQFKPLIHTWSLGLEEQFYLLAPLLFIFIFKFIKNNFCKKLFVYLATIFSAVLFFYPFEISRETIFYLLPFRLIELMLGCTLAVSQSKKVNQKSKIVSNALSYIGYFFVFSGLYLATENSTQAIKFLPLLGTFLIIKNFTANKLLVKLFQNRVIVWIGTVSYSAYLLHQPIFAFARISSLYEPSKFLMLSLIIVIFSIAYLLYEFVEVTFRLPSKFSTFHVLGAVFSSFFFVIGVGIIIYLTSGFASNWKELVPNGEVAGRRFNAIYNETPFKYDRLFEQSGKSKVLIAGNSFARDFINMAEENNKIKNVDLIYKPDFPDCIHENNSLNETYQSLLKEADYLIFASGQIDVDCWNSTERFLLSNKVNFLVIGTKNFGYNMNAIAHLTPSVRKKFNVKVLDDVLSMDKIYEKQVGKEYYVNILKIVGLPYGYMPIVNENGMFISQDMNHLTKAGAQFIGRRIFDDFRLIDIFE